MFIRAEKQIPPLFFFRQLKWLDGHPLRIEPYRQRIFTEALYTFNGTAPRYNLALLGRGKKNYKSCDLILAGLYRLLAWKTTGGNTCLIVATDEGQAADDLDLCKKLIRANPMLDDELLIKQKEIERRDVKGSLQILPGQDTAGAHGKSFLFLGIDELHTQRDWNLLEALQPDPTRNDALTWITSYASIYHRPGVPLFDLFNAGKLGNDPRMYFSWYAADYCTDPAFENLPPEEKANPSRATWADKSYLQQQQRRLPAHKFRRLHLNLPGSAEGSAFAAERVMDATERGVGMRPPLPNVEYFAFVDMSGGSNDDATLAISHKEGEGDDARYVLDVVMNQGPRPPFDPRKAVERFAKVLKEYRCYAVVGDKYAGEVFINDFQSHGIAYTVSTLTKSEIYQALEAPLNSGRVVLLDEPKLESQLLGLVWRANKIDHANGEHDDFANAAAGAIHLVGVPAIDTSRIIMVGERLRPDWPGENTGGSPWSGIDSFLSKKPDW